MSIFHVREVRRNPGDLLTSADIAKAVTPIGRDLQKVADLVNYYRTRSYLRPVARETEGRKAWLFLPDQALVAEVLIRMGEMGVSDEDAALAIGRALNAWRADDFEGDKPPRYTPGMHVLRQYEEGARDWSLELWVLAEKDSGRLVKTARLHAIERGEATAWGYPIDKYEKRSVFAVDLVGVLDRIHPRNRPTVN